MAESDSIRIVIADDHALLREGLRRVLEMEDGFKVVGEAGDGLAALERVRETEPDVVVLDISMPGINGIEATRQIKSECPSTSVIALTIHDDQAYVLEIIKAGGQGYLLKDSEPAKIVEAINIVLAGGTYFPEDLVTRLVGEYRRLSAEVAATGDTQQRGCPHLTDRELEILRCLARGASNRDIADRLFIAEKTVKNHVSNLLKKLSLTDRTQAAIYAIKHRLVELD